ncbi:hypothetical protein GUJ93_ZPchr0009g624 [Zizania palustris]|uniref:Uncharacterized protein n=1 Tax=Zizania palustris TaxID=103762 RepID=A0A8J5S398_ZIZPA|nr:hypothetical protein GUJ93_ZPchr0009g624 [Zizania palustris]
MGRAEGPARRVSQARSRSIGRRFTLPYSKLSPSAARTAATAPWPLGSSSPAGRSPLPQLGAGGYYTLRLHVKPAASARAGGGEWATCVRSAASAASA